MPEEFQPDVYQLAAVMADRMWSDEISDTDRLCFELANAALHNLANRCVILAKKNETLEADFTKLTERNQRDDQKRKRRHKNKSGPKPNVSSTRNVKKNNTDKSTE